MAELLDALAEELRLLPRRFGGGMVPFDNAYYTYLREHPEEPPAHAQRAGIYALLEDFAARVRRRAEGDPTPSSHVYADGPNVGGGVRLVAADLYERDVLRLAQEAADLRAALNRARARIRDAERLLSPGMRAGTAEAKAILLEALADGQPPGPAPHRERVRGLAGCRVCGGGICMTPDVCQRLRERGGQSRGVV